jgi:hypothetical protein
MEQDCFFYSTKKGDDTFVVPLCVDCQPKHPGIQCWFWQGSHHGYGPFRFACEKCGHVIHQEGNEDEIEETETAT